LGRQCFIGCSFLYNVTCNWTDPKSYTSDVFDFQVQSRATLHVPAGTKSKYAALTPWSSFNAIVENTSDGIAKTSTRGIMVSTDGGIITIKGLTDGENVNFYTVSGILLGSAKATNGTALYSANTSDQIIIAKIGTQSIKVALQ